MEYEGTDLEKLLALASELGCERDPPLHPNVRIYGEYIIIVLPPWMVYVASYTLGRNEFKLGDRRVDEMLLESGITCPISWVLCQHLDGPFASFGAIEWLRGKLGSFVTQENCGKYWSAELMLDYVQEMI